MRTLKWAAALTTVFVCTGSALAEEPEAEGAKSEDAGDKKNEREFIIGPTLGASSSSYVCLSCSGDSDFASTGRMGAHVGVRMILDNDPRIGLGATGEKWYGFSYQALGGVVDGVDSGGFLDEDKEVSVDSVEDQLVFDYGKRLRFLTEKSFSPYIASGGYLGANFRYDVEVCSGKKNCESIDITEVQDDDVPPAFLFFLNRLAVGASIETGGRVEVKERPCDVFLRYSLGSARFAGGQVVWQGLTTAGAATYF